MVFCMYLAILLFRMLLFIYLFIYFFGFVDPAPHTPNFRNNRSDPFNVRLSASMSTGKNF